MAAFSYQHYPFPLESVFSPNPPPFKNLPQPGFMEEPNINIINSTSISQFYPPPLDMGGISDNEPSSVTKKHSTDSSSVVDKLESGEQITQQFNPSISQKRKNNSNSSSSTSPFKEDKEGRSKKQKKNSHEMKEENKLKSKKKVTEEEAPTGYIHVRARRGQATDSHSLAERVRREKISERMKILQRLVPGCDKVTGKALMLDEIINHVRSLQNQVEFLSMKLASVNPLFYYDFGMDFDAFTLRADQGLSNYIPSLSSMHQQFTPAPPAVFTDETTAAATDSTATTAATFAGASCYHPVIDASASLLLQGERPSDFIPENDSLMWGVDEQRQKFLNPAGLINNNSCSLH